MIKSRFQLAMEEEVRQLQGLAEQFRSVTPTNPAADAIDFCAGRVLARLGRLDEPTLELSPADWGAEQDPPMSESTVRRRCKRGEIAHLERPIGIRILAGTKWVPSEVPAEGADLSEAAGTDEVPAEAPEPEPQPLAAAS